MLPAGPIAAPARNQRLHKLMGLLLDQWVDSDSAIADWDDRELRDVAFGVVVVAVLACLLEASRAYDLQFNPSAFALGLVVRHEKTSARKNVTIETDQIHNPIILCIPNRRGS